VTSDPSKAPDSYKCRTAQKLGIPVVSTQFIEECLGAEKCLNPDPFVVFGKTKNEQFSSGKIAGEFLLYLNFFNLLCNLS
jgi:hypothetical protein